MWFGLTTCQIAFYILNLSLRFFYFCLTFFRFVHFFGKVYFFKYRMLHNYINIFLTVEAENWVEFAFLYLCGKHLINIFIFVNNNNYFFNIDYWSLAFL